MKKNNLKNQLTMIVPTYNRKDHIRRQFDWIKKNNLGEMIIVDGSPEPDPFFKKEKNYYHMPVPIMDRIRFGASRAKTPFCMICADDDYLVPSGVTKCLEFLQNNSDFVSSTGKIGAFMWKEGKLEIYSVCFPYAAHGNTNFQNSENYISNRMKHYIYSIYSIHRTDVFCKILSSIPQRSGSDIAIELAFSISGTMFGKHAVLDETYSVFREVISGSGGRTAVKLDSYIKMNQEAWAGWTEEYYSNLSRESGMQRSKVQKLGDVGFGAYLDFLKKRRFLNRLDYLRNKFVIFGTATKSLYEEVETSFASSSEYREIVSHIEQFSVKKTSTATRKKNKSKKA